MVLLMLGEGQGLADEDHIVRYVPWTKLLKDEDDNVLGFLPQAFELRPDEESLSVNWLEFFSGDRSEKKRQAIQAFRASVKVGKKSAFGIANVGEVKDTCLSSGARVRIVYMPEENNASHALIKHLPRTELALFEALATTAFSELVQNTAVPED